MTLLCVSGALVALPLFPYSLCAITSLHLPLPVVVSIYMRKREYERAREQETERPGDRESKRARQQDSMRAAEQDSARERESERARERESARARRLVVCTMCVPGVMCVWS